MKEAIGGAFLFNIVIAFILLFTGIMTVTINRTKAFNVKENIVASIEDAGGIAYEGRFLPEELIDIMAQSSYRAVGDCSIIGDDYTGYDRNGLLSSSESSICIKQVNDHENSLGSGKDSLTCYYSIALFYRLEFPMLRELFQFSIIGETKLVSGACGT